MGTIKSGSLERQANNVLWKSWKTRHCVLYCDGEFSSYEHVTDATAEFRINMQIDCRRIEIGFEVGSTNLPRNRSDTDSLFAIITKHKSYLFMANSPQDCNEWVGALRNSKNNSTTSNSKVPVAPVPEMGPPPSYAPRANSQHVGANSFPASQQPQQPQQIAPGQQFRTPSQNYSPSMQPLYGQPRYGQPMYGQPMYGQPMYISQQPQPQQQRSNGVGTGGLLLAGGGGLLGGYMLGSMMNESMHHHDYGSGSGFSDGGGGGGFDSGGFGDAGDFGGGGFDF